MATLVDVTPLRASPTLALDALGGKGRSLALLADAGRNVPPGFVVHTRAYRRFVADGALQERIVALARRPELKRRVVSFARAVASIQDLFASNELPEEVVEMVRGAYAALGALAVAVRSSATAEDLPELSFAGQQQTYLNVCGADAVVAAVKRCWASLWSEQALGYRHRNGIDPNAVAMAVVVQAMVPSDVSGIAFTANPTTGERGELVVNASFGLGEAVVGGEVAADAYVVARSTLAVKETTIGAKARQVVLDGEQGTRFAEVAERERGRAALSGAMLRQLAETALEIEQVFGTPQDVEWAFSEGELFLLQSRAITNLPPQPIAVEWTPRPPAKYLSRRQIVENMPDPICPLFEEIYLTEGLESPRKGKSLMVGGGPLFVTLNGYAYQRFDWPQIVGEGASGNAVERDRQQAAARREAQQKKQRELAPKDIALFKEDLGAEERATFERWIAAQPSDVAYAVTMPESDNPTFTAFNNTTVNDRQVGEWFEVARPRLVSIGEKWSRIVPQEADDDELLAGIRELGIEEGHYWSSNAGHTFGVAKSTDDQFQCFLRETLPDHNFISGQFLSGIESKTMQANGALFEIAELVRGDKELAYLVGTTPARFLMRALKENDAGATVLPAISTYLETYGHQGYSMDFVEPTQVEDPSALFTTLKGMVQDENYHPQRQAARATAVRTEKHAEIAQLLDGLQYWQFRFRLWLARRYNHMREEVAFYFGYTWRILRPMAFELGRRMVARGTFRRPDDTFYLVSAELRQAIAAAKAGTALPELGAAAAARRELREARKRHHPPGTVPAEASQIPGIAFKETQIKNDDASATMRGFPVSSGRVTAPASVVFGPSEFDKMRPGTILVSPLTTPAWTHLFAQAAGLVTDMGSILAHGSIVAREYGIPAVLGTGNGTVRIRHGQTITIDGDAGTVVLHDEA